MVFGGVLGDYCFRGVACIRSGAISMIPAVCFAYLLQGVIFEGKRCGFVETEG